MIITIFIIVALLFLFLTAGSVRLIYSLFSSKNMHDNMKTKVLDIFVYLGICISLVTSVTNLLQVIFAAINRRFADSLSYYTYQDLSYSDVRFAIASLVVMFPIYVLLSWYVAKDIQKYLYKQDILIRKFFIYGTLFVTILSLIGTLVSVIYTYLGGELSTSFALKAASVFGVALALFGYYFYALRRDYSKKSVMPALITVLATLLVLGSVVWSISIIGTPKEMRAKKIDNTRLSDISRIQQEIFNKFQTGDKLPSALSELENAFQGYAVPVDPITAEAYEYKVLEQPSFKVNYETRKKEMTSQASFELCATFDTVRDFNSRGQMGGMTDVKMPMSESIYSVSNYYYDGDQTPFWNHKAEKTCFKRIITPEMYYGN